MYGGPPINLSPNTHEPNGPQCTPMYPNGPQRIQRTPTDPCGPYRTPTDPNGLQWTQTDSDRHKWTQTDPDGTPSQIITLHTLLILYVVHIFFFKKHALLFFPKSDKVYDYREVGT